MLLLQGFDIKIQEKSIAHNLVVDHLIRIERVKEDSHIHDDLLDEVLLSQPKSRRDDEPKKKMSLTRDLGVATIVILENYGKPWK